MQNKTIFAVLDKTNNKLYTFFKTIPSQKHKNFKN